MAQIINVSLKTYGLDEVLIGLAKFDKGMQSKLGKMAKIQAETAARKTRELCESWNISDTGALENAISTKKVGPYTWTFGDYDYEPSVPPHGAAVEYGFQRHWIHRSQVNPFSGRLAWFVGSDKEFIEVGPMAPRPVFETGRRLAAIEYYPKLIKLEEEAIKKSFRKTVLR